MKKRILSLFLALVMVFGLLPAPAIAADTVIKKISSAEEFAAMKYDGNYKLTKDIITEPAIVGDVYQITSGRELAWLAQEVNAGRGASYNAVLCNDIDLGNENWMPIGKTSSYPYKGIFDGQGYEIKNLKIYSDSSNQALFGYVNGGTVKNLTVSGSVKGGNSTAGIIGELAGTALVEKCMNKATVNGGNAVGGIVGKISTGYEKSIQYCVNEGPITGANQVGGIVGYAYYTVTVDQCYNRGAIEATASKAGGIVGHMDDGSAKFFNCYTTGTVTGKDSAAVVGKKSSGTITNCYYLDALGNDSNATSKTSDELKDLAGALGSGFRADTQKINGGYPILDWQYFDPNAKYTVILNVEPTDSVLTWNGKVQPVSENGKYTFENMDVNLNGYSYSVSNEAGDYATAEGTVTVKNKDVETNISLELNKHTLTFDLTPQDAELTVKDLTPNSDGSYSVVNGTYNYTVTKFGYETATGTVTVDRADKEQSVTMTKAPSATVRFVYADDAAPAITVSYAKSQWDKIPMSAENDGSYQLPIGHKYEWSFDSAAYIAQSGTIDLTKAQKGDSKDINVPMSKKPTGTGTVEDPYLISDASQLRWFAAQVNDNGKNSICAQLTNNIVLGNENWTPIGQYARNAYNGTFDGQYHEIQNLKITGSASNHYGLFGVVGTGTVKNLTVSGEVSVTSNNNSYGIAAIVGCMNDGSAGTVENCINKANVSGGQNVAGIVGYISSGYSFNKKVVQNCANYGSISSTSNNAAGIAANISGAVTIQDCYNRGTITGGGWHAGGITAYLNSSYATIKNCYTTGSVSGSDSNPVIGKKDRGTIKDCYYLGTPGTDPNATAKTSDELKALAPTLGGAFITAPTGINDGYPIFRWQIPTYAVTFTVDPADARVTIDGQTGTQSGSNWTFALPDGEYNYTVSAFGYGEQTGKITVSGSAVHETVKLTAVEKHTVTFNIAPADANAKVTVTWNGKTIDAASDGSYLLPDGEYTYTVKAKGYAPVRGTLNVSKDETVSIKLTPSTAWDGSEKETPSGSGTQAAPYQIENGAQLAWLADKVNSASTVSAIYAVLTDDIDLGGCAFTPIGTQSGYSSVYPYQGSFDGQGHTVTGLNVSAQYAGLFGVIQDAEIKNVIVQGTVTSSNASNGDAGGIVGRAIGTANTITNCGNEANVSGGSNVGGILGNSQNWNTVVKITGCYNTGSISAKDRAAGIIGRYNGSNPEIVNCYNTGAITSENYATGIYAGSSSKISNCYTTGTISGKNASSTGAFTTSSYNTLPTCYYLTGSIPETALTNGATALPLAEMQSKLLDKDKLGTKNWKSVRGVNNSLPVLKWQEVSAPTAKVKLVPDAAFVRSVINIEDGDKTSLPTAQLQWKPVADAKSYTVSLWRAEKTWVPLTAEEKAEYDAINSKTSDSPNLPNLEKLEYVNETAVINRMTPEQKARLAALDAAVDEAESDPEQTEAWYSAMENRAAFIVSLATDDDLGSYVSQLTFAQDISGIAETQYDLTSAFAELPEGIYYAAVAVETDEQAAYASSEQVNNEVVGIQSPYNRMNTVTGVKWDGATAKWDGRENFTGTYQIDLYTVDGSGENRTYKFFRSFSMPGQYTSANLANAVAAEKQYAFTVTAIADSTIDRELGLTDSVPSDYSKVYNPSAGTEKPSGKEWVEISTAKQWIALANVKDEPSAGTDSPSNQAVEWSKNYRLTADIDFSKLSAADQMKTKSIGTVTYPFLGEFDGQGYKITGLTLSNSDSGLFWYIGATGYVHNLTIDSANVLFSDNAAVLAHNNYGRIEHCAVVNTNITADTGAVLGGMVSRNYGVIRDSYVEGGTLTSNTTTAVGHAGFVGANETGGLIERCWTSMNISTQSAHAAGFVGLGYGGTIKNCFALGNVSARGYSGGFVGRSVYQGNVYENCYAAGVVTVTEKEGNGFIGGNQDWSSFQYDQSEGIKNCYYNSATASAHDYGAKGKSLDEMKAADFLTAISGSESGIWVQDSEHNNGLPYLSGVKAPETAKATQITVNIAVAAYNKDTYSFEKSGDVVSVTMDSNGNTRLVDLMDAAQAQGQLTYTYSTSTEYGRFIHTINGREVNAPDGWMFTINDKLSNVSASLATVNSDDNVLWFEGTTENHFQGPAWKSLSGEQLQWNTISTKEELLALANAKDAETLGKNYKLTADLDLSGKTFPGIGTAAQPFTGRFDGQNHTISNVTVPGTDNVGFFGVIKGAKIQNLNLNNVNISGKEKVGGLVGYAQAELDENDLSKNVANLIGGCTVSGTVTGSKQVGGLVGLNEGTTNPDTLFSIASAIDKSSAEVTVTGKDMTGGLVGENTGTITKSAATGAVTGTAMTGGFAGDNTGDIYDSHAKGAVSGSSSTGGFAGSSSGAVKTCYSLGTVTGTDYTGSFAGSLAKADTVIGAGLVTVKGTPTQGYNGGLAGQLGGIVSGLANQITVKNAFGNCTQAEGNNLSVIGNTTAYPSDTQKAALKGMTLSTRQEVGDKLYELFRVNLPDLAEEAAKYVDSLTVPASTETASTLSLLKPGNSPAPGVTVTYAVTDAHLKGGETLTLMKGNETAATISVSVQLSLADTFGSYHKTVQVILPVTAEKRSDLMDAIAKGYTGTYSNSKVVIDMAAYANYRPDTANKTTAEAKQNFINYAMTESAKASANEQVFALASIGLQSIGTDPRTMYPVNSSTPIDLIEKLNGIDHSSSAWYVLYTLAAYNLGNFGTDATEKKILDAVLKSQQADGSWNEWGDSIQTTSNMITALSFYTNSDARAKVAVDKAIFYLSAQQKTDGTFDAYDSGSDADVCANVVMALSAAGINPDTDARFIKNGSSALDGLLRFALVDGAGIGGFGYQDNLTVSSYATEEGFRALIAAAQVMKTGKAFNIYDFHTTAVVPGRATGEGESSKPVDPPAENNDITVTVAITADNGTVWLPAKSVTVKDGSTVYHAFVKALEGTGITQDGAANGYVRSITKDGRTLAEFTLGKNSGWLYQVNGKLPNVSLTQKTLAAGDAITFYYTADWTTDPGAGSMGASEADRKAAAAVSSLIDGIGTVSKDSGSKINAARAAYENLTDTQKALVSNYHVLVAAETAFAKLTDAPLPFVDVDKSEWYYTAVQYAYENGLFSGTSATTFAPEDTLSRSMVVSVLYRLSGSPSVTDSRSFSDVSSGLWYTDAVNWAAGTSVIDGVGDNRFAPESDITREQLATILYRYAKNMHLTDANDTELSRFKDADTVSDWAAEAMVWAVANGLISGTSDTTLSPKDTATRAQFAQIMYQFSALAAQK